MWRRLTAALWEVDAAELLWQLPEHAAQPCYCNPCKRTRHTTWKGPGPFASLRKLLCCNVKQSLNNYVPNANGDSFTYLLSLLASQPHSHTIGLKTLERWINSLGLKYIKVYPLLFVFKPPESLCGLVDLKVLKNCSFLLNLLKKVWKHWSIVTIVLVHQLLWDISLGINLDYIVVILQFHYPVYYFSKSLNCRSGDQIFNICGKKI